MSKSSRRQRENIELAPDSGQVRYEAPEAMRFVKRAEAERDALAALQVEQRRERILDIEMTALGRFL